MQDIENTKSCLDRLLANSYVTLMLTQHVHWNATGETFFSIHKMTQAQYEELQVAVDDIAEHIRAHGNNAPSGMQVYQALSTIEVKPEAVTSIDGHLNHLIEAHLEVKATLELLIKLSVQEGDSATEDLAIDRLREHDKVLWMLKASLKDEAA